ncbi:MAG: acylneuraminate cytidylyltransferase family protein [Butyrivibrio sp.]|nr:acylneuraminate cytidylyltransferase family protein [Butyrivibrio sp.]
MRNLAVIPARSGSKGLKDKNIKELLGKPLMAYTIEAAIESGLYDTVHVSTDTDKYAQIAMEYGADVPFLRKKELSTDAASTWDVVRFVIQEYEEMGKRFDVVTVLQPTSPLRTKEDIIDAYSFFEEKKANMISSVCEMEHSPLWSNTLPDDLSMEYFEDEETAYIPRQKLPVYYRENGAVYILKVDYLMNNTALYKNRCFAYIMEKEHSVDIDEEIDFLFAQIILADCH